MIHASFLTFLLLSSITLQTSIYDVEVITIEGKKITLSAFKNQKIVVTVSKPELIAQKLDLLDSLYSSNPTIRFVVLPASDFTEKSLEEIKTSLPPQFPEGIIVLAPAAVKKKNGINQSRLVKWLTNVSENGHFDADVITDDQLYMISESGILYNVLEKNTPMETIDKLLKQEDVKN